MNSVQDIQAWYDGVRGRSAPKLVTGLRGTGRSQFLELLYNRLRAAGVPRKRVRLLDSADPCFRRYATGQQTLEGICSTLPSDGPVHLLLREPAGFTNPEVVLAALARNPDYEIVATSSSRRLVKGAIRQIYGIAPVSFEVLPEPGRQPPSPGLSRSRGSEILVEDVLSNSRIMDVPVVNRICGWLSDNLGDMISLRIVANAVSPRNRTISPHTIGAFLESLVDAHIVCKAVRWDTEEDCPLATGYRYYFTDPDLRLAQFGPAPEGERRRMALNRAWLWLSHEAPEVFSASGHPEVHFVTRNANIHAY